MKRKQADDCDAPAGDDLLRLEGDIFHHHDAIRGAVLAHQCNCVTTRALGLAKQVFERHDEADDYRRPARPRRPGTATLHTGCRVANLYAQVAPGPLPRARNETRAGRLALFVAALDDLARKLDDQCTMVLVPHGIGCGLAGGRWEDYEGALSDWARKHVGRFQVAIVKMA